MPTPPAAQRSRRGMAGAWAIAPFAVVLVVLLTRLGDLPEVPIHWSGNTPDGFAPGPVLVGTALAAAGLAALAAALVALLAVVVPDDWSRWLLAALSGVGGTAAAAAVLLPLATRLAGGPARVSVLWALGLLAAGVLWAWGGYAVHGRTIPSRSDVLARVPEGERVVPVAEVSGAAETGGTPAWATDGSSGLLLGLAAFVAVVVGASALLAAGSGSGGVAALLVVLAALMAGLAVLWSRIRVVVDGTGLVICSRLVPLRLLRVPAAEVVGAGARNLDPGDWGGLGLRVSPGRTAYLVGGGTGLVVHRADGRRVAVEVQAGEAAAQAGAAALRGVAARAEASR